MSLEDLLRSFASASPLHIALALLFILIARSFTASKDVGSKPTRDESDSEEEDFPAPQPAGDLTKRELATFDGKDPTKPILLAAKGVIYDVTRGRDFYGAGASYNAFAGKDCSRAMGKVSLDAENLSANVHDFAASERDTLNGWVAKFQDKYPVVGKVKDGDYNGTF